MKNWGLFLIILVGLCASCKKAELKKPTKVNFSFDLNSNDSQNGDLKFVSGEINIGKFNLSGDRLEGDDIAFERIFSSGLYTDLNGSAEIKELDYDIPQGEYTQLKINLNILDAGADPSLMIKGTYKFVNGPTVGVEFQYYGNQEIEILGEDFNGSNNIVMDKMLGKKVSVEFDPLYWFEPITVSQFESANLSSGQGQNQLIVSPTENVNLYTIISARINMSNRAVCK